MFWKILIIIVTIGLAIDIFGTIHNAYMIRENRKLGIKNAKRSKKNKEKLNNNG